MLAKLIRYDFIAMSGKNCLMLIILAVTGVIGSLLAFIGKDLLVGVLLFIAALITVVVFTVFFALAVIYLYNTLSGKQSGFTFTLPVKISYIVLSKVINIIIWGFIIAAAVILFWFVFYNALSVNSSILDSIINPIKNEIAAYYGENNFYNTLLLFCATLIAQFIGSVFLTVLSVSLSCYPKFRDKNIGVAAGVLGYFVIYYAFSILTVLILLITNPDIFTTGANMGFDKAFDLIKQVCYMVIVAWVVISATFYFLSTKMFLYHKNV